MTNVLGALMPRAVGQPQRRENVYGEVYADVNYPLPASLASPLYVVMPDFDPTLVFTVPATHWKAEHGGTLPAAGAACKLSWDSRGYLWCDSWAGTFTAYKPIVDPD